MRVGGRGGVGRGEGGGEGEREVGSGERGEIHTNAVECRKGLVIWGSHIIAHATTIRRKIATNLTILYTVPYFCHYLSYPFLPNLTLPVNTLSCPTAPCHPPPAPLLQPTLSYFISTHPIPNRSALYPPLPYPPTPPLPSPPLPSSLLSSLLNLTRPTPHPTHPTHNRTGNLLRYRPVGLYGTENRHSRLRQWFAAIQFQPLAP